MNQLLQHQSLQQQQQDGALGLQQVQQLRQQAQEKYDALRRKEQDKALFPDEPGALRK